MNWQLGLIRLWVVATLLWIGAVVYEGIMVPQRAAEVAHACFEVRKDNTTAGNPFDCFDGQVGVFPSFLPASDNLGSIVVWTLGPPLVLWMSGMVVMWISAAFRRQPE